MGCEQPARVRAAKICACGRGCRLSGWLACVVYSTIPLFWLMIHPFAKAWRSAATFALPPADAGMDDDVVAMAAITAPWRSTRLYRADWAWVPAALLFSMGLLVTRARQEPSARSSWPDYPK